MPNLSGLINNRQNGQNQNNQQKDLQTSRSESSQTQKAEINRATAQESFESKTKSPTQQVNNQALIEAGVVSQLYQTQQTENNQQARVTEENRLEKVKETILTEIEQKTREIGEKLKLNKITEARETFERMNLREKSETIYELIRQKVDINQIKELKSNMNFSERVKTFFEMGKIAAQRDFNGFFSGFRDHAALHTAEVAKYAKRLIENAGVIGIKAQEILDAVRCHDFGMMGGLAFVDGKIIKDLREATLNKSEILKSDAKVIWRTIKENVIETVKSEGLISEEILRDEEGGIDRHIDKQLDKLFEGGKGIDTTEINTKEELIKSMISYISQRSGQTVTSVEEKGKAILEPIWEKATNDPTIQEKYQANYEKTLKSKIDNLARKNHPLNSALAVLTEEGILKEGSRREVVALLVMSHSKSTSGISDFSNKNEWIRAVNKIEEALKVQGSGVSFNKEYLVELINNESTFRDLQDQALIIRDADALSDIPLTKDGDTIMQTGDTSRVEINDGRTNITGEMTAEERRMSFDQEVLEINAEEKLIRDALYDENGNKIKELGGISKSIHSGEKNVVYGSTYNPETRTYSAEVVLIEPNSIPNSTFKQIVERLNEVVTYGNCVIRDASGDVISDNREFVIKLPKEAQGTQLGKYYESQVNNYFRTLRSDVDIAAGKNNPVSASLNSFLENYEKSKSNVRVEYVDEGLKTTGFTPDAYKI